VIHEYRLTAGWPVARARRRCQAPAGAENLCHPPALHITNCANNLRRLGFSDRDLTDPGSDRLIDALVLHGDAATIAAGLRAELDGGANHVGLSPQGGDPIGTFRAAAEAVTSAQVPR